MLLAAGEERQPRSALDSRLRRACRGGLLEHALDDDRILLAVAALAEVAAQVDRADRGDGTDAMVGGRRGDHVAAGGADAERADALGIDPVAQAEERHGGFDVLDAVGGVLEAPGLALALALKGGVEREGDEALARQALGIQTRGLLLDAAGGMPNHDRGPRAAGLVVGGVQVSGEHQAGAWEGDVLSHDELLLAAEEGSSL